MITTSKIKVIESIKQWGSPENPTYYHNLEMDNGDKINIGKKKPQKVGWELTYEITGDGQQEYQKAKYAKPEEGSPAANKMDDNVKGIKIGHAITNAVSLLCAGVPIDGVTNPEKLKNAARMILKISEELNNEV